jgi:hypothetical protein
MSKLATSYDLRSYAGPILDQGVFGSCMPNSIVSTIDMITRLAGKELAPLSRMQNYADTRNAMGSFNKDSGSIPEIALDMAKTKGIAPESMWKYTPENMYTQPTEEVYAAASGVKISGWTALNIYQHTNGLVNTVKDMLSQGKPVILGFLAKSYFMYQYGPLEDQTNTGSGPSYGGHATMIVGYDDNLNGGSYIIKNSWGTSWGDNGYGTISYNQFTPRQITYEDMPDLIGLWTIDGVNDINLTWSAERMTMAKEYAVIFGRAADTRGMDWWAGHLKSGNVTKEQLADYLINSYEGKLAYGSKSNAEFVDSMYDNILGRDPDAGGLAYWTQKLDDGVSRGALANYLMDTVEVSTVDIVAQDYLYNKVNLSSYISISMQYDGENHTKEVREAISGVTSNADNTEDIKIELIGVFGRENDDSVFGL